MNIYVEIKPKLWYNNNDCYLCGCWWHKLCLGQRKHDAAASDTTRIPKATPTATYSINEESSVGITLDRTSCSTFLKSSKHTKNA